MCTYAEESYEWLRHICDIRVHDIYKENTREAYCRLVKELNYIKNQDSAPLFKEVFEALHFVGARSDDYYPINTFPSSLISYLLGFSNIDPLNSVPKLYPEFCFGLDGDMIPAIVLKVTADIYKNLVRYFDWYRGNERITCTHFDDGSWRGIYFTDPNATDEDFDLCFRFSKIDDDIKQIRDIAKGEVFEVVRPQTFAERVKCFGLSQDAERLWENNAKQLYTSGEISTDDLIVHREDVYEFMLGHGLNREDAFRIVRYVRQGKVYASGWKTELLNIMKRHNIPDWYMESCSKIRYLSSRAYDMALVKRYVEDDPS